jgi:hypothetical protein
MVDQGFFAFQLKDAINILILAATVYAVYAGPIRAVQIAHAQEDKALKVRQKSQIFASLMKTRRFMLDAEHVSSLNLIQLYFHDVAPVIAAYKTYIRTLSRQAEPGPALDSLIRERDDAFVELMQEMAKSLGYSPDKKELQDLAYSPQGWATDNDTIRKLHFLLIELLENRRTLVVANTLPPGTASPYPPPPQPRP